MNIRSSAAIRQNYNEIADMCRKTVEPIFLAKNGAGDLVVMDIETYNRYAFPLPNASAFSAF
nr:type II toxin-antitoxin system Phd/YefM family antitoxin [Blautia sp. Marseille-P3201T]